ncbi:50S ribosomal protein L2 [symbiont of Argiope bruennichi]|uniref:50S ribosomal protein L2 n=1 Tax=symbiont of Argiope bruennichi TaxID=2810479 RepID=UPI003DA287C8
MAIRKVRPLTPGQRGTSYIDYSKVITKKKPEKSLVTIIKKNSGRNNQGKITVRHQGNAHKRKYRMIDFFRNDYNIKGKVVSIEYDPNRTAFIALISYLNGKKSYIIAPKNLKVGDYICSFNDKTLDIKPGNSVPLKFIPDGTLVHNIQLNKNSKANLVRSAGCFAQVLGISDDPKFSIIKLPSGEVRLIKNENLATIGTVGNEDWSLVSLGKAGKSRHLGIRPTVRGSAMNPNDHPHGGGEGRSPIGRKHPLTPWGKNAYGVITRKKKNKSNKFILKNRKGNVVNKNG